MTVHDVLGPGLLEKMYAVCLVDELEARGINVETEVALAVRYRARELPIAYRLDMLVERCLVVEVKCVTKLTDVHEAQLRTYLRLINCRAGLLLNFNVARLRDGFRRVYPRR